MQKLHSHSYKSNASQKSILLTYYILHQSLADLFYMTKLDTESNSFTELQIKYKTKS